MSAEPVDPSKLCDGSEDSPRRSAPEGVILERFKRMQMLPPHMRCLEDEFFVQSFLRRKHADI